MENPNTSNFWVAGLPAAFILFLMWGIFLIDLGIDYNLKHYGIYPGSFSGLKGILFSPLLHGSFEHLINNSLPILILIWAMFYSYRMLVYKVLLYVWLVGGTLVWLSGSEAYHIGMSGVIYGLCGFLFFSGLLRKMRHLMGLSLLVVFLYGSLIWGVFPIKEGISWEGHLWGAVTGSVLAFFYRKEGPQQKKYDWENQEDTDEENPYWMQGTTNSSSSDEGEKDNDETLKINYIYKGGSPTPKNEQQ